MNKMRRETGPKIVCKKDLHSLCGADNPPNTLLLGDDFPQKICEA